MERTVGRRQRDRDFERRSSVRYPLNLELRYTVSGGLGPAETGTGRSIDLSRSGIRFTTDRRLSPGQRLEVYVDWPAQLYGSVRLQLVAGGVVVRTVGTEIAVRLERPEFRTRAAG